MLVVVVVVLVIVVVVAGIHTCCPRSLGVGLTLGT